MEDPQKKSIRLYQLHQMFNERVNGYRTGQLAKHLGVSRRTIQRDLDEIQAHPWGLPLVQSQNSYWRLDSKKAIPLLPINLVRDEAAALFLGARLLTQHSGRLSADKLLNFHKLRVSSFDLICQKFPATFVLYYYIITSLYCDIK